MIALDQVTKTYPGDVKALKGISLQIKKGEFVFVVGQSGSGKTTLFKLLLKEMEKITGYPILLNTSFNVAGQPIVESPLDALNTFLCTDIDLLILENYIIFKS